MAMERAGRAVLELSTGDNSAFFSDLDRAEARYKSLGGAGERLGQQLQELSRGFQSSAQQASANGELIARAFSNAEKSTAELVSATRQFAGADIISKANAYAEAIKAIGGAEKLTATEQAQVNRVITEALAKYQAIGGQAPAALQQLATATKGAVTSSSALDDELKQVQDKIKGFSGDRVIKEAQ